MIHKKIPICGLAIRQQALEFYKFLKQQSAGSSSETFFASRGWFDKFKKRFSLSDMAMQSYENLYQDMSRRRKQKNIMHYFNKTNE